MRSTINLMNIKPAPAENFRRGVPAPVTLMNSFRVPAIQIAGGGNSDVGNPTGSPDVGVRSSFKHCLRKIDLWVAGKMPHPQADHIDLCRGD